MAYLMAYTPPFARAGASAISEEMRTLVAKNFPAQLLANLLETLLLVDNSPCTTMLSKTSETYCKRFLTILSFYISKFKSVVRSNEFINQAQLLSSDQKRDELAYIQKIFEGIPASMHVDLQMENLAGIVPVEGKTHAIESFKLLTKAIDVARMSIPIGSEHNPEGKYGDHNKAFIKIQRHFHNEIIVLAEDLMVLVNQNFNLPPTATLDEKHVIARQILFECKKIFPDLSADIPPSFDALKKILLDQLGQYITFYQSAITKATDSGESHGWPIAPCEVSPKKAKVLNRAVVAKNHPRELHHLNKLLRSLKKYAKDVCEAGLVKLASEKNRTNPLKRKTRKRASNPFSSAHVLYLGSLSATSRGVTRRTTRRRVLSNALGG